MGVASGYLLWSGLLPDGPRAITAMEQLLRRQMGTVGRMIVAAAEEVPPLGVAGSRADGTGREEASDGTFETHPGDGAEAAGVPAPGSDSSSDVV
jgi:hypothetical protein